MSTTPLVVRPDELDQPKGGPLVVKPEELDDATPKPKGKSLYQKATEYDQEGEAEFSKRHPVIGPVARTFSSLGRTVVGAPEAAYHAITDEATPEEKALGAEAGIGGHHIPGELGVERLTGATSLVDAVNKYADPETRPSLKGAMSVLPEALGQGVGTVAAGEIAGEAAPIAKEGVARAGRTADNALRPSVRLVSQIGGGAAGSALTPTHPYLGGVGGYHAGPSLMESILPKRAPVSPAPEFPGAPLPDAGEFYERKGTDLLRREKEQRLIDKATAQQDKAALAKSAPKPKAKAKGTLDLPGATSSGQVHGSAELPPAPKGRGSTTVTAGRLREDVEAGAEEPKQPEKLSPFMKRKVDEAEGRHDANKMAEYGAERDEDSRTGYGGSPLSRDTAPVSPRAKSLKTSKVPDDIRSFVDAEAEEQGFGKKFTAQIEKRHAGWSKYIDKDLPPKMRADVKVGTKLYHGTGGGRDNLSTGSWTEDFLDSGYVRDHPDGTIYLTPDKEYATKYGPDVKELTVTPELAKRLGYGDEMAGSMGGAEEYTLHTNKDPWGRPRLKDKIK